MSESSVGRLYQNLAILISSCVDWNNGMKALKNMLPDPGIEPIS